MYGTKDLPIGQLEREQLYLGMNIYVGVLAFGDV